MMAGTGIEHRGREVLAARMGCYTCRAMTFLTDGEAILRFADQHVSPWWLPTLAPEPTIPPAPDQRGR